MNGSNIRSLTASEWKLIQIIRSMKDGELKISVRKHRLTHAEQVLRYTEGDASMELTEEPKFGEGR